MLFPTPLRDHPFCRIGDGRVVPRPDLGIPAHVRERGADRKEPAVACAAVRGQVRAVWGEHHRAAQYRLSNAGDVRERGRDDLAGSAM